MTNDGETGTPTGPENDALDDLVAAEDWAGVVAALDTRWSALLANEPQLLRRAITALPPEVLAAHPRWAHAVEYVNRFVQNDAPKSTRFRGTAAAPPPRSLLDLLAQLTARAAAGRANGRLSDAVAAVREARAAVDEATPEAREQLVQALPELTFQWAMVWEYVGELDAAVREYTECFDHAVLVDHTMMQARAAGSLAWLHALAGRNLQARNRLAALPAAAGEWWQTRASISAVFAQTLLLIDELRFDEADRTLAAADLSGVTERWPAQKLLAALLARDAGSALAVLSQIDATAAAQPAEVQSAGESAGFVALARWLLFTALGNRAQARAAVAGLGGDDRSPMGRLALVIEASTAAEADDFAAAGRRVAPLTATATAEPRVLVSAFALTAAAQRHDPASTGATAATSFALALELARTHGLLWPLLVLPRGELAALIAASPAGAVPDALANRLLDSARDADPDPFAALTPRERAVLAALLEGRSTAAIAESLFVSPNTVKSQLRSIYRKVGVRSRRDLERAAVALGHA
ncbi:LuxR C-terminal-related transcriptional regulator [Herbiconiux sp. CPCC 205716]|uniref:LuxR C-terminal-related transcriptional regulator n=1 Tax=Herbiconiux gentiana TaxID=2970912 RepID=A0ABT2GDI6_9MICO|nr:LuxR C-terminal-related transcriptional regulator [Herbiconiux gentiana]MCS5713687.1 LuxR C-terminal-related transcriptional regulator [Herbiconiux gentiana]